MFLTWAAVKESNIENQNRDMYQVMGFLDKGNLMRIASIRIISSSSERCMCFTMVPRTPSQGFALVG